MPRLALAPVLVLLLLLAPAAQAADDRWIVTLDGPRTATTQRILDLGAGALAFRHLPFVAVAATPAQADRIRRLPGVARVDADHEVRLAMDETRAAIGLEPLEVAGLDGRGVTVASVDTGVDGLHPDLDGAIAAHHEAVASTGDALAEVHFTGARAEDVPVAFAVGADSPVAQDSTGGHGTHVAGIIAGRGTQSAGRYRGVAPGASLVSVGMGDGPVVLAPLVAFDWLLEVRERYDIEAVNGSFQSLAPSSTMPRDALHPINVATKRVHDAGIAVVMAAGNWGPEEGTTSDYAGWPWVISVGNACVASKPLSSDICTGGDVAALATGSSRGTADGRLPGPDLVAPGTDVGAPRALGTNLRGIPLNEAGPCAIDLADIPAYTCMTGTSMAAPHVTGTIALMEQAARRDLSPDDLKRLLVRTASPLPAGGGVHEQGAGMLDAAAAARAARP